MTINEARTLSELRDLLIKVQPLIEKASRFANTSGDSADDKPLCMPLNNGVAAHMIGADDGTLGILFLRADQTPRIRLALTTEAHSK